MRLIATILLLSSLSFAQVTMSSGQVLGGQMGAAPGPVALPQNWVNSTEYVGTPTNTINYPTTVGSGGSWTCSANSIVYGPYSLTAGTPNIMSGLQAAFNDAETCRASVTNGPSVKIILPAGTISSTANGITIPQTAGDNSTNFIVVTSTTPLTTGQTVCSHGIQDNVSASTQPGIRNLGCNGSSMSYQLGTSVTTVSGAFTLANGTATNTSAYNDVASMYTVQNTGSNQSALSTAAADSNGVGPHHWAILNGEFRPQAGLVATNAPIAIGQGNETVNTCTAPQTTAGCTTYSQIPFHIHIAYDYAHGDWGDAPNGGTAGPSGSNSLPNVINASSCIYCSFDYNYTDKAIRPSGEGHSITFNLSQTLKMDHDWWEGESIGAFCGGQQSPLTIQYFVVCQDVEDRSNRYTYPYSWLLAGAAGFKLNSSMTTTVSPAGGTGALLNLTSVKGTTGSNSTITGVAIQTGGTGYGVGNILTPTQTGNGQTNSNGTIEVTTVASGVITGIEIVSGTGYSVNTCVATSISSGSGSGATVNIASVDASGRITGVTLTGCSGGSGYTANTILNVTGGGGTGGTVAITSVTSGVIQGYLLATGSGYLTNSYTRKNARESKAAKRMLIDGNIIENVDGSGGQNVTLSAKTSSGDAYNFFTELTSLTITNNIVRNGCSGVSIGDRSNPGVNGFGVSLKTASINYTNNLMYNISQSNPNCPNGAGFGFRVDSNTQGTTWTNGTAKRNAAGTQATLLLGGAGSGYVVGSALTTTTTSGSGSGLTVNITSVNQYGQVTGVTIAAAGSGYAAGDTATINQSLPADGFASVNIDTVSGGAAATLIIGQNSAVVGAFQLGDPVLVTNCADTSFNTYATLPFTTMGPLAIEGTQAYGLMAVIANTGTALASTTGCTVNNIQSTPQYLTAAHNSDFLVVGAGVIGDPFSAISGTTAQPCALARNLTFTNTITVGVGASSSGSGLGEGTRTTVCGFDPNSETYAYNAIPGRSSISCPAGTGIQCYTAYNNGSVLTPTSTYLWLSDTAPCSTTSVTGCLGIVGNMSLGANPFNYALADWHNYRLCHSSDAPATCSAASTYAAGGTHQASDGTDTGADFTQFDPHQVSNQYVCAVYCGTPGPFKDH